jgi:hypothetical protein
MYKKENCVCKGLTFLFTCVVVKLFFRKFINITRVVESSFKRVYKVNYYNYMVCNVRRICNVYIVNIKVRKTYPHVCPKFVIMCKYENCVCKYLTFLFRCVSLHCTPCIDFYSYNNWPCTRSWMIPNICSSMSKNISKIW